METFFFLPVCPTLGCVLWLPRPPLSSRSTLPLGSPHLLCPSLHQPRRPFHQGLHPAQWVRWFASGHCVLRSSLVVITVSVAGVASSRHCGLLCSSFPEAGSFVFTGPCALGLLGIFFWEPSVRRWCAGQHCDSGSAAWSSDASVCSLVKWQCGLPLGPGNVVMGSGVL